MGAKGHICTTWGLGMWRRGPVTLRHCCPFSSPHPTKPGWPQAPDSLGEPEGQDQFRDSGLRPPCVTRCPLSPMAAPPPGPGLRTQGLRILASPLPTLPQCQQQFPGRPGDSSRSQPRETQCCGVSAVSLGVWGMGLRLYRAGLPLGRGAAPPTPTATLCLPH